MQLAVLLGSRKSPRTRIRRFPGVNTFIVASFDPGCLCDLITCQESGWTQNCNLSTPGAEQEGCHKFKASLDYVRSSNLTLAQV